MLAVGNAPFPASAAELIPLSGRRIAFTTPLTYGERLSRLIHFRGGVSLPIPTVAIETTPAALSPYVSALDSFSALAFTSRAGIAAVSQALTARPQPLPDSGETFTVAALGKDADLLHQDLPPSALCRNPRRIRVLVPAIATPSALAESLGPGSLRRILCPVPAVIGLAEPPVIPDFIADLQTRGWDPVRAPAYETRWTGPSCSQGLLGLGHVDAVVFTSTTEVEGLVKGLAELGWDWGRLRERWPEMVVAAHGPVTARGANRFGVDVDVVSSRFSSFDGVLDALASWWGALSTER